MLLSLACLFLWRFSIADAYTMLPLGHAHLQLRTQRGKTTAKRRLRRAFGQTKATQSVWPNDGCAEPLTSSLRLRMRSGDVFAPDLKPFVGPAGRVFDKALEAVGSCAWGQRLRRRCSGRPSRSRPSAGS